MLVCYPVHNITFHMGALISHETKATNGLLSLQIESSTMQSYHYTKSIAFCLQGALCIQTLLYGCHLLIRTDHKNLTYAELNSMHQVQRWRFNIEQYSPSSFMSRARVLASQILLLFIPTVEGNNAPGPHGPAQAHQGAAERDAVASNIISDNLTS